MTVSEEARVKKKAKGGARKAKKKAPIRDLDSLSGNSNRVKGGALRNREGSRKRN